MAHVETGKRPLRTKAVASVPAHGQVADLVPEVRATGWLAPALLGVVLITILRVFLLAYDRTDLFVDEAQYWLWAQDLAWGYYSKPPLIAAVIGAATWLAGSDSPFWVRMPAPILHAVTALLLGTIAAKISRKAAIVVALGYVTLPMVAVGSALISTDTVMLPLLALALLAYLNAANPGEVRARLAWATLCGVALGLAFLAKYAAIYFLLGAAAAWATDRSLRLSRQGYLLASVAFLLTIAWNLRNGFVTVVHTMDNADWSPNEPTPLGSHLLGLAEFVSSQFAVFGPLVFGVLIVALLGRQTVGTTRMHRLALSFCWPVLGVVCLQAFASHAYANWAAAAYIGGSLLVFPMLLEMRRVWLVLSFVLNGAIALALPLTTIEADRLTVGQNQLLLERYVGQAAMSRWIIAEARSAGLSTIVAEDRGILADLFYTGRDSGLSFEAVPPTGRPRNHYALKYPYTPSGKGDFLFVSLEAAPPACRPEAEPLASLSAETGTHRAVPVTLYRISGYCWDY